MFALYMREIGLHFMKSVKQNIPSEQQHKPYDNIVVGPLITLAAQPKYSRNFF